MAKCIVRVGANTPCQTTRRQITRQSALGQLFNLVFMLSFFPILTRAYRTQWRTFGGFVALFVATLPLAMIVLLGYALSAVSSDDGQSRFASAQIGGDLWLVLAWMKIALALLVAPATSAGAIAHERERGLLDGLIMAPLSPARIVIEKWLVALATPFLVLGVLLPFEIIALALRGTSQTSPVAALGFTVLLGAASAAIGIACSAWARRAHLALRSAFGLVTLWILGSGGAALLSGDSPWGAIIPGYVAPIYIVMVGHTNPILGAYDLIVEGATGNYWAGASLTLLALLALCGWSATRALQRPLVEAPFIADTQAAAARKKRAQGSGVPEHFSVPIVGVLQFANPVLGREVRSKFRLRQPPLGVIIVEGVLALLVAYFYARTLWTAFSDPSTRGIIFVGVVITGLVVTLISCAIMGANGFAREHEGGTWESVRLSMLRPREIVRGKAFGIGLTCLFFSIPIWPLLLPCINWSEPWQRFGGGNDIAISTFCAVAVVWLGSVVLTTMWGLWWGRRSRKTSAASGGVLGTSLLWFAGLPLVLALWGGRGVGFALMWLNPFGALFETSSYWYGNATALGLPFLVFALASGALIWALLERNMKREFG